MFRKRIRGVRRHFRRHQQSAAAPAVLDQERLARNGVDSFESGIAPWFDDQRPPLAFRRLRVARLVADFHRWRAQLTGAYPTHYLAVWLFEPRFGQSQLVAAVADHHAHYSKLFSEEGSFRPLPRLDLPPEYRDVPGIRDLAWRRHADIAAFLPEDYAAQDLKMRRKPHWNMTTAEGDLFIAVQIGWVWVGQVPPTDSSPRVS